MEVVCVVIGRDGLNADAVALLAEALERAGALAALASGGPALRGAAPAEAGRHVGLCLKSTASDLGLLYVPDPSGGALALRKWFTATQALLDASLAATRTAPPLAAGSHGSLAALAALLEAGAPSAWSTQGKEQGGQGRTSRINILSATPATHVDEDLLTGALLDADGAGHLLVKFILVKQPVAQQAQRSIHDELACTRACSTFMDTVAMSDNGTCVTVDANAAAFERLALGLLLPERTPGGVPHILTTLNFPAPLHAGGPRSVRLNLRPGVLPLHDAMTPVKVCRCHGRAVLCRDAAIGSDDVAHFLALADKNNVCSVSAKRLEEHAWIPNAVSVGRDNYILLPSFYNVGRRTAGVVFTAHCTVSLSGVTEAHLFGIPWCGSAVGDDDEDAAAAGDADDAILTAALGGAPGGSADTTQAEANGLHVGALVIALARSDLGLVLSCETNLDTGMPTPFRCFYLAQAPHQAGDQGGATPSLLLRRIAGREELLPSPQTAAAVTIGDVPASLETEVAASLTALPFVSSYDPLQNERGVLRVIKSLVAKSLAPPAPIPPSSRKRAGHESGHAKQPSGTRAKGW